MYIGSGKVNLPGEWWGRLSILMKKLTSITVIITIIIMCGVWVTGVCVKESINKQVTDRTHNKTDCFDYSFYSSKNSKTKGRLKHCHNEEMVIIIKNGRIVISGLS